MNTQLFDSFYHNDEGIDKVMDLTNDPNSDDINSNKVLEPTNVHHMQTYFMFGIIIWKTNLGSIFSLISQNVNMFEPKNFKEAYPDYNLQKAMEVELDALHS
jgi:hypothetical protein